jgi:pyruvate dehydrogenase E1 component alpha subunit
MPVNTKVVAKPKPESTLPFSSQEEARQLYYLLLKCRLVDEANRKHFRTGKFLGTYYSAVGQEATTVVPAFLLKPEDVIAPQHREIGCSIGRQVPLKLMLAHNMGRRSGFDKGKNHPCHYGGSQWNIITPASTMAAQTVVGSGCALAFKLQKQDNVVIAFTGEGGTSQAGWHEACNLAGVHKLPMVFICQNNLWAESVPASLQAAIADYSDRAKAYGFPGISIDGNDVIAVYTTTKEAIARARRGEGPTLIEMKTYRWYGHSEIDPADYRTQEEVEEWKKKDPLPRFEKYLLEQGVITPADKEKMTAQIAKEHEEASEWAAKSPLPAPEEAIEDVYVPGTRVEEMHREQNRNFY